MKREEIVKACKDVSVVVGALSVIGASYLALGLPTPAWSGDLQELNRAQVHTAIRAARNERRDLVSKDLEIKQHLYQQQALPPDKQLPEFIYTLERNKGENERAIKQLDGELQKLNEKAVELEQ